MRYRCPGTNRRMTSKRYEEGKHRNLTLYGRLRIAIVFTRANDDLALIYCCYLLSIDAHPAECVHI